MSEMHRRDFLKTTAGGVLALGLPAGGASGRRRVRPILVVCYLRGGQDALNVLVPWGDARYREIRPTIAIPDKDDGERKGVVRLDRTFGLHPALAPLAPLFERKLLAPIVCVGSPHPTRSHFDAQDFMEYGAPGLRTVHAGWLNRYLSLTANAKGGDPVLRALAMQGLLPRSLRGDYPVLAVPDLGRGSGASLDEFSKLFGGSAAGMTRGRAQEDAVKAAGRATIRALRRYHDVQGQQAAVAAGVSYPRGGLGDKLRRIARLIKAGEPLEVACADYNGWDHHAGEGGTDGRIAQMLAHLAGSLRAFLADLGAHADRTLVLTMTEFGRTCRENGNAGTDHGHGGLMLALGGPVRGGKVYGDWRGLEDRALYQGRDLPVTTDFRSVMAEALTTHMRAKLPRDFFPGYRPRRKLHYLG